MSALPPNQERLAKAAEALVQAASLEVDSITQQKLAQNLDALKESFDSKLSIVAESVKASNQTFDTKIDYVNENLSSLQKELTEVKSEISGIKALLEEQKRQKSLEMAMNMTDINSFEYYDEKGVSCESRDMAKVIIKWFILDRGYNFSKSCQMVSYTDGKAFRTKLMEQLTELIGHEPRLVDNANNTFTVFYK